MKKGGSELLYFVMLMGILIIFLIIIFAVEKGVFTKALEKLG